MPSRKRTADAMLADDDAPAPPLRDLEDAPGGFGLRTDSFSAAAARLVRDGVISGRKTSHRSFLKSVLSASDLTLIPRC